MIHFDLGGTLADTQSTGPEQFARLVANIAPSLHSLRKDGGLNANGVFVYRLMFAVRFANFHLQRMSGELQDAAFDLVAMFEEDVVPRSWWAVVLCDAIELIQYGEYDMRGLSSIYASDFSGFHRQVKPCYSRRRMPVSFYINWKKSTCGSHKARKMTIFRSWQRQQKVAVKSMQCSACRLYASHSCDIMPGAV